MKSIVRTRVKNGWWLSCGHKIKDTNTNAKLAIGDIVECVKCDVRLSKHSSNIDKGQQLLDDWEDRAKHYEAV